MYMCNFLKRITLYNTPLAHTRKPQRRGSQTRACGNTAWSILPAHAAPPEI